MKVDINVIREGAAEFAKQAGISQVEAACEMCLVLANVLTSIEDGLTHEEAINAGVEAFTARWGEVFE